MSTGSISLDILLNKILTDRSKNVIALFVGDTYDEIDSDIVQIDSRADVIIFSSSVVTAKMDLMQRFFGFVLMSKIFSLSVQSSCPDIRMCSSCRD